MPIIGGGLCLVAGSGALILGLNQIALSIGTNDRWLPQDWPGFGLGLGFTMLGLTAIAGSSHALARRSYPTAIAGAVCALLALFLTLPVLAVLGVPALILIVISRGEFGRKAEGVKLQPRSAQLMIATVLLFVMALFAAYALVANWHYLWRAAGTIDLTNLVLVISAHAVFVITALVGIRATLARRDSSHAGCFPLVVMLLYGLAIFDRLLDFVERQTLDKWWPSLHITLAWTWTMWESPALIIVILALAVTVLLCLGASEDDFVD